MIMFFKKKKKKEKENAQNAAQSIPNPFIYDPNKHSLKYIYVICRDNINLEIAQKIILLEVSKYGQQTRTEPDFLPSEWLAGYPDFLFDKDIAWLAAYPESLVKDIPLFDLLAARIMEYEGAEKLRHIKIFDQITGEYDGCEYLIIASNDEKIKATMDALGKIKLT